MHELTVISNSSDTVLYLTVQDKSGFCLIAELFTGDPNSTKIPCIQTASSEFKERLRLLDVMGEFSFKPKDFFDKIPDSQHFLLVSGHIDDRIRIYQYRNKLCLINGIPIQSSRQGVIMASLANHYEMIFFQGDEAHRMRIGINDKARRICRFCGKSMPDVTFKQKAHAISESLGNKGLVCLEECDECNSRFSFMEQDISAFLRLPIVLKGIKGKKGNPTLKGDDVSMRRDSSCSFAGSENAIVLEVNQILDISNRKELLQSLSKNYSFTPSKYTPQNIYKCICKYVLSLIDSQYLPYFKETINWIREPLTKHRLPPVWHYSVPAGDAPSLAIMIRKHNHKDIPYCWGILSVAGNQFLFIIPFCSLDTYKFVGKSRVKHFLDGLKNIMPNINLTPICMNGIKVTNVKNNFLLKIPPDLVEGRDYYFIQQNI